MNEKDKDYMRREAAKYKQELMPLLRYMHWLTQNAGKNLTTQYEGDEQNGRTMPVPVYDSTLLSFIREADKTSFMDRNYAYIYSRNGLKTPEDEKKIIERATIQDWNVLCGILTRYVRGGMTQSYLWKQGMTENIFYLVISKMKEIIEFWDVPIHE